MNFLRSTGGCRSCRGPYTGYHFRKSTTWSSNRKISSWSRTNRSQNTNNNAVNNTQTTRTSNNVNNEQNSIGNSIDNTESNVFNYNSNSK